MLTPETQAELNAVLQQQFGQNCHIETASPCHGGDIHQAYQLHTACGNFFVKLNQAKTQPLFATEALSLQRLANTLSIVLPKVIAVSDSESENHQAWLLLEYLDLTSQGDDAQRGKDLALLHHQIHHAAQPFGWPEDNYIGHTQQLNQWQTDWVTFYGEQRLRPQLSLAKRNGAGQKLLELGEALIADLEKFFQTYHPKASPLHGDLWGGNSAFLTSGEAVFYDPASYYGDRETDLAMTELFGGYSPAFYQGYESVFPLDKGYSQRKSLYNLYHLLNHYNLFGAQYQTQAEHMINELLQI